MGSSVTRFSVSVEPSLLEEFDKITSTMGYNRSTAVQVAMRDFLTEQKWTEGDGDVSGTITLIYDHDTRGLEKSMKHIEHDHLEIIKSSTHVHLNKISCLEILAVKGNARKIRQLSEKLAVLRGVKQIKLAILEL